VTTSAGLCIRDALTPWYPGKPTGTVARHVTTLAALISGIVGSKRTPLPHMAPHVPDGPQPESRKVNAARGGRRSTERFELRRITDRGSDACVTAAAWAWCTDAPRSLHRPRAATGLAWASATARRAMVLEDSPLALVEQGQD